MSSFLRAMPTFSSRLLCALRCLLVAAEAAVVVVVVVGVDMVEEEEEQLKMIKVCLC